MINNHIAMTDSIPSSFGMPVYGRALGAVRRRRRVRPDDRGRPCCAVTAAMGRIKGDFPGTSAWRPPS